MPVTKIKSKWVLGNLVFYDGLTGQDILEIDNVEDKIIANLKATSLEIGDVSNGNYSYFESDGIFVSIGSVITHRDEYVGGEYFIPTGASAPDIVDATIGGVVTKKYSFDGVNTTEKLGNTFEVAHDIALNQVNEGTENIEFHIHIAPSNAITTGTVKFTIDWSLIKAQDAPVSGTQVIISKDITAGKQYYNIISGVNLPVPTGNFDVGDLIEFTISRNPSDVSDTYAADIIFYKCALHVPVDTLGSRQRYIK